METKALKKSGTSWPSLSDTGWMEKFFNAPIDAFFNIGKIMNIPAVNASETEKDFILCVAAPGMDKTDFKVETVDNILTIGAERKREEKEEAIGHYNRREYNFSSWSRSFTLPENCDGTKIEAAYTKGELKITIPKLEIQKSKKVNNISVN